ncbi:hypothetical protein GCM10009647_084830 [Streptomyces sanglieri]
MNITFRHNDHPSAYQSFEEIPAEMRLESYESRFENKDVLEEYISSQYYEGDYHDDHIKQIERTMASWKDNCDEMGSHPALVSPDVVKVWCEILLERRRITTLRSNYIGPINAFYRYLMWHVDFPHTYNPVQFAVREYSTVRKVWAAGPNGDSDD